jgi:hypothetical protein
MTPPSTGPALGERDVLDPTITRCVGYALAWGYQQLLVGNAYAFVATLPTDMAAAKKRGIDVVGPENDLHLARMVKTVLEGGGEIVAGWGNSWAKHGSAARGLEINEIVRAAGGTLKCLRTNQDGSPVHPLYQPKDLVPIPWARTATP